MKMHIGVDESHGLIHSIETTSANEHDLNVADKLLYGKDRRVWADSGYIGAEKRKELSISGRRWHIAMRPGKRKQLASPDIDAAEKIKASVRAKVEHSFFYIKCMFGYRKMRYRGLEKNTNRLYVLAGLTNLLRTQRYLLT